MTPWLETIGVIIIAFFVMGGKTDFLSSTLSAQDESVLGGTFCDNDIRECPDGTIVQRLPPDCRFICR